MRKKCYKDFFFNCFTIKQSGFISLVESFPASMEDGTDIGALQFPTCCVLTQCYLNHNVSIVLQAMYFQVPLKFESGLPFLLEVLEGLNLAHLIGIRQNLEQG